MIIDGHAHAAGDYLKGINIIQMLDENKVDYVVLAGTAQLNSEKSEDLSSFSMLSAKYPLSFIYIINKIIKVVNALNRTAKKLDLGNQYVFDLVRQYPNRIIQFYWVNPEGKNVIEKINSYYKKYNFRGLKLHQGITKVDLKSENMHAIAKWAEEKEMPIFIHLCSKKDAKAMVEFANRHKRVNFIIGHLIGLEVFIEAGLEQSNVLFDISCYQIVPEIKIKLAIEKFGYERIIMGSDTPYGKDNLKQIIARVQGLDLSDSERNLILGGNLQKLLNLG